MELNAATLLAHVLRECGKDIAEIVLNRARQTMTRQGAAYVSEGIMRAAIIWVADYPYATD